MKDRKKLDPRSKLAIFAVACFTAFSGITTEQELTLMTFCLLAIVYEGEVKYAVQIAMIFAMLFYMDVNFIQELSGVFQFMGFTICRCIRFFLPILAAAYLAIHTSTIGEYISALMAMKCSNAIIIPVAVMFRFIPTIMEEFTAIRRAMKMRNISGGFHLLEYALVPLLLQSSIITDELSAAVMARGLERNAKRTSYVEVKMTLIDNIVIAFGIAFFLWSLM